VAFWSNPRIRSAVAQALVLGLVVAALAWLAHNVTTNLERQGIASGLGFFGRVAGFDIIQHLIPYDEQSTYGRAFVVALLNTLLVSALGVLGATVLGFLVGVARLSPNWLVSRLALVYVEALRNVPLLLQLFFWYFSVLRNLPSARESLSAFDMIFLNIRGLYVPKPELAAGGGLWLGLCAATLVSAAALVVWGRRRKLQTGHEARAGRAALALVLLLPVAFYYATGKPLSWELPVLSGFNFSGGLSLLPELVALIVALTTYTAAFIAEIVRAGILAVPRGQLEAALALGLSRSQALRLVVVPQAMRVIVPPLTSQYLNLTKNSSLAAAIAYPDLVLVFAGTVLMQTGQAVEVIAITMGVYLFLSLAIAFAMNLYNRRVALVSR
jgi:general L-amino acid transport system permease protein